MSPGAQQNRWRMTVLVVLLLSTMMLTLIKPSIGRAEATSISLSADTIEVVLSWDESSGNPVSDYEIELSGDGGGIWYTYPDAVSPVPSLTMPRSIFGYGELPIEARITTVYADTSTHLSNEVSLVIPSIYQKTTRFTVGAPEVIADNAGRTLLGLDQWLDGTMGFFERQGKLSAVSANGRDTALIDIGESDFIESVTYTNGDIQNQAIASDHASGGPVYYDEANDRLIMFYHGELHQPDASDFYSYIGLAISTDGGLTFEDLGQIIRTEMDINDPDRTGAVDVGPGSYIIKDGYFYVYFKDANDDGTDVAMAVARASVDDVLDAAALGTTSPWLKYSGGTFSTPGVGGSADNIFGFVPSYINWMDVVYLEQLNQYVMVATSINDGLTGTMHYITTSEDGIQWSLAEELYDDFSSDEMPYVTLSAPGYLNQKSVPGNEFELIRTVSTTAYGGFRWTDARVERLSISFEVPETQNPESNTAGGSSNQQDSLASTGYATVPVLGVTGIFLGTAAALHRTRSRKKHSTSA